MCIVEILIFYVAIVLNTSTKVMAALNWILPLIEKNADYAIQ